MTAKTNTKNKSEKSDDTGGTTLAKISPSQVQIDKTKTNGKLAENHDPEIEKSLVLASRLFLRAHGIRKSAAAIRDAVDIAHEKVGPKEAVSALSMFGFKASFGSLKLKNLEESYFPLIAFHNNGEAILINSLSDDGKVSITLPLTNETKHLELSDFNYDFSGYVIT